MVVSIGIHKMFVSHDLINKLLIAKEHPCNVCESVSYVTKWEQVSSQ